MSDGNTSDTGGKPDGPWGRRPDDVSPVIGRTVSRLRRVLEGEGDLARQTSFGNLKVPDEDVKKKKRRRKKRRSRSTDAQWKPGLITYVLLVAAGLAILVLSGVFLLRSEVSVPSAKGLLLTRIQMKGLELAVRSYYVKYRRLPDGTAPEILSILAGENLNAQNPEEVVFMSLRPAEYRFGRLVKHGDTDEDGNYLDGWGRPMDVRVDHINRRAWIRSVGPNGVDERGEGDDIEMLIVPDFH